MSFSLDWFLTIPGMLITGGVILLLVYYCLALGDGGENVLITNEVLHEFGMLAPAFAIILLLYYKKYIKQLLKNW